MALMERVATLIRANLNDLIDKAEDPEKMLKQVILDMQNQLMQVKTQVAIAMADQHLLKKKLQENEQGVITWMRKAELAVEKQQDELARPALERVLSYRQMCESFRQQSEDQQIQVENLKGALHKLEQKLIEAQNRSEILAARHRRARALGKAAEAQAGMIEGARGATFDRMKDKVDQEEALSLAKHELAEGDLHERLVALGREDEVEQLLRAIKEHKNSRSLMP
ncbi:MAG TPA: PspA/IM30 family protein [Bryobacteraceae bacterium]|nr:PspA/IM30 family protein [Bryobacteraceae bacterium]